MATNACDRCAVNPDARARPGVSVAFGDLNAPAMFGEAFGLTPMVDTSS